MLLDGARPLCHAGLVLVAAMLGCGPVTSSNEPTAEMGALPAPIHEPGGPSCRRDFNVGETIQNFELRNLDNDKTISPVGYRDRVMVLNFWGTWCKPCLKELPQFDQLYRKYRKYGMTLVAVATDEEPGPVQSFVDKHALKAKIALAGEDAAGAYDRPDFPFTFVVDGTGTVVAAYEFVDESCLGELEQVIRDELAKLER